jgi:hypothetical protein
MVFAGILRETQTDYIGPFFFARDSFASSMDQSIASKKYGKSREEVLVEIGTKNLKTPISKTALCIGGSVKREGTKKIGSREFLFDQVDKIPHINVIEVTANGIPNSEDARRRVERERVDGTGDAMLKLLEVLFFEQHFFYPMMHKSNTYAMHFDLVQCKSCSLAHPECVAL